MNITKKCCRLIIIVMLMIIVGMLGEGQEVKAANKLKVIVKKSTSVKLTDYRKIKVKVYFNGKDVTDNAKIKYKNSNKKAVKISRSDDFVGVEAWPKKIGKSKITITAKYCPTDEYTEEEAWDDFFDEHIDDYETYEELEEAFNREKQFDYHTYKARAKCTVKAKGYNSIRAYASLISYNTRTNVFGIKVKNISTKKIKINSSGAAVYDDDYTVYDRNVKLTGGRHSVSIKPGETKKIYFSVIGSLTWYDVEDFQLCSNWTWGGKTYRVSVNTGEETYAYIKGKWKWIGFAT